MYYVMALLVYLLILFPILLSIRKPDIKDRDVFATTLVREHYKSVTKSDVKSRKKRVKVLPLYQRGLYWVWFWRNLSMVALPAIGLSISRYYLIDAWFVPDSAYFIDLNSPSLLVFGFGAFLVGIPIFVVLSTLSNRGIIREADRLYQMGSFQEYPAEFNALLAKITLVIGLPLVILGFNSYRYLTPDYIVSKSALSLSETITPYDDIDYIEHSFYVDGDDSYTFYYKNGESFTIFYNMEDNVAFFKAIADHQIEIKIVHVKPLFHW